MVPQEYQRKPVRANLTNYPNIVHPSEQPFSQVNDEKTYHPLPLSLSSLMTRIFQLVQFIRSLLALTVRSWSWWDDNPNICHDSGHPVPISGHIYGVKWDKFFKFILPYSIIPSTFIFIHHINMLQNYHSCHNVVYRTLCDYFSQSICALGGMGRGETGIDLVPSMQVPIPSQLSRLKISGCFTWNIGETPRGLTYPALQSPGDSG